MNSLARIAAVFCVFLPALSAGQMLDIAPREGILVLRNGGVLSGKITQAGMRFYVTVERGEIRVAQRDVEMVCRDLNEAYRRKASALRADDATSHIDLAEWCVRHRLHEEAGGQLDLARRLASHHPRIALVERRLQLSLHPVETPTSAAALLPARTTNDKLDQLVRSLPAGTVETFTTTVQPLLLNSCATSGCHGPRAANKLRLEHLASGRPLTRRITQRNLDAVLKCVDQEEPAQSGLLTMPLENHAGGTEPLFSARDVAKYQQLVDWVNQVSHSKRNRRPHSVRDARSPRRQAIGNVRSRGPLPGHLIQQGAGDLAAAESPQQQATSVREETQATAEGSKDGRRIQFGAPQPELQAADPFDPAVFNRAYGTAPPME